MDGKISNFMQRASVRRYIADGGRADGLRVVECDNGKLRFLLNASKALDVMQLFYEGENISFVSKNGFTSRETPFESRFEGGMLYTCGLDGVGRREGCETHGSLHNTPAEIIGAECGEEGIFVEGETICSALFGRNLRLRRRIYTAIGSGKLSVEDTLINDGYREERYCLLYHVNLGYPMLDEGGRVEANVLKVLPRTPRAEECVHEWAEITEPLADSEETCYYLDLAEPRVSYINRKRKKKFTLTYSKETLPLFIEWKSMACGDYALGLEPTTTRLDGAFAFSTIAAGERKKFFLELETEKLH